jgi:DNA-binding transcriptional LysR family regulator
MSKEISLLESEVGEKLLFADGRGIGISSSGQKFYHSSLALLSEYKRFIQSVRTDEVSALELRIGTFEVFSTYFFASFIRAEPETNFQILEKIPGQLENAIISGELDYGVTYLPSPNSALNFEEIGSFRMGIFGKKAWSKRSFEQWPFAIPVTNIQISSADVNSLDLWPPAAPRRHVKHRLELLETGLQVAADGLAVVHCPDFVVKLHNQRVRSELHLDELTLPRGYGAQKAVKVYLVSRKESASKALGGKLARFMRLLK